LTTYLDKKAEALLYEPQILVAELISAFSRRTPL
jgi:hypothetical protein